MDDGKKSVRMCQNCGNIIKKEKQICQMCGKSPSLRSGEWNGRLLTRNLREVTWEELLEPEEKTEGECSAVDSDGEQIVKLDLERFEQIPERKENGLQWEEIKDV